MGILGSIHFLFNTQSFRPGSEKPSASLGALGSLPAWASARPKKPSSGFLSQASAGTCLESLEFRGQNSLFMVCSWSTSIGVKVLFQGMKWANTGSNTTMEANSRVLNRVGVGESLLVGQRFLLESALQS